MWPGAPKHGLPIAAGILWDQLESAGVQDIAGVGFHTSYMNVVAIKQRFAGHAKQAGHAVIACSSSARNGRYVVIVDEDIDPTDLKEVLWAMETRVCPSSTASVRTITAVRCLRASGSEGGAFQVKESMRFSCTARTRIPSAPFMPGSA